MGIAKIEKFCAIFAEIFCPLSAYIERFHSDARQSADLTMSTTDGEQDLSQEREQLRQAIERAGLVAQWYLPLDIWINRWRAFEYAIEHEEYMPFAATLALLATYDPQHPPSDLALVHDLVGLDYAYWQARDKKTGKQWSPLEEAFGWFRNRYFNTVVVWQSDVQYPSPSALEGLLHTFRRTPLKLS